MCKFVFCCSRFFTFRFVWGCKSPNGLQQYSISFKCTQKFYLTIPEKSKKRKQFYSRCFLHLGVSSSFRLVSLILLHPTTLGCHCDCEFHCSSYFASCELCSARRIVFGIHACVDVGGIQSNSITESESESHLAFCGWANLPRRKRDFGLS